MDVNKIVRLLVLAVIVFGMHTLINKIKGKKVDHSKNSITKEAVSMENIKLGVIMKTSKGDINIKLFPDVAPLTVLNLITLAKNGYYDGLKFHRVIADFMIQGGDPTGTGAGGPGYNFKDEFKEGVVFNKAGILAMANAGPGTNGSQFFITHVETPWLNYKHTIFGEVVSADDQTVVNAIKQGDIINSMEITGDVDAFLADEVNKDIAAQIEKSIKK